MKKITHNGIFRALCAVACAAAGTALAFLLVMMGIAVYGSFHGRTQEQITQLAMDRISGEKLCLMLDEMTAANVEVMAEEGEYPLSVDNITEDEAETISGTVRSETDEKKLQDALRQSMKKIAEQYESSAGTDFAVLLSSESDPERIDTEDENVYIYKTAGYKGYRHFLEAGLLYSDYYTHDSFFKIVTRGAGRSWYGYGGTPVFGKEDHIIVLYSSPDLLTETDGISADELYKNREIRAFLSDLYAADSNGIPLAVVLFLAASGALVLYCISAGKRRGKEGIHAGFIDRIPLEILLAVTAAAEILLSIPLIMLLKLTAWDWGGDPYGFGYSELTGMGIALFFLMLLLLVIVLGSIAVRIKTKTFWKNTLIFRLGRLISKGSGTFGEWVAAHVPLFVRWLILVSVIGIVSLAEALYLKNHTRKGAVLFLLLRVGVIALISWLFIGYSRLRDGAARIALGKLNEPVAESGLTPDYRLFARDLNNVGQSIQLAVEERMKSEHLKTQLITNVSHDIKTPLTSIINYVDLLQKADTTEEEKKEYLEILSHQSDRLKKLIQDLIDASKASSGAVELELTDVDLCTMIGQVSGEYQDKLDAAELNLVSRNMREGIMVKADRNLLWRVMDNLYGNILKYAMPGTRVYVEIREQEERVTFSFSNISKAELGISGEELMERFVRGDQSRNTEGSGLGLSIAKSLMELMGGSLDISVDGDMFKAVLQLGKCA